jgi:hypothetical protein
MRRGGSKVFDRLSKVVIGFVAVGALSAIAWGQAAAPQWKDQGEFDLAQSINKEADPQKKIDLLNQWEQKYPDSALKGQRGLMKMQIESQIAPKAMTPNAPAADLAAGQKAAQDLVENLDVYFADSNKPAQASADQWTQAKQQVGFTAHMVLATVAMGKKTPADDAAAENELKKALEIQPNAAQTSYSLGTLILRERKVERMPEALYDIARAAGDTGPLALPPQGKTAVETFLKKAYEGYHGDDSGLDDLKKTAMSGTPLPPAGFHIDSVTEIQAKQEGDAAKFASEHPDIALWRTIRDALKADGGDKYFEDNLKGAEIPPAAGAFKMFNAKVIAQNSPKELVVNVDNLAGDATLQFDAPLNGTVDPGTTFKFKGTPDAFVKDPYMLTFTGMAKEDVEGLPDTLFKAAPPKRRPATPAKKK